MSSGCVDSSLPNLHHSLSPLPNLHTMVSGIDPEQEDELIQASRRGKKSTVERLLRAGIRTECIDKVHTPFTHAASTAASTAAAKGLRSIRMKGCVA